jgi:hypothetical protein
LALLVVSYIACRSYSSKPPSTRTKRS